MEVTRQYWTVAATGLFLASWGVIVAEPVVLLGSGAIAAWLLARQYRFVRAAASVPAALTSHLTTDRRVTAEATAQLTLEPRLERPVPVTIAVTVTPPVGASGEPATAVLSPGDRRALTHTMLTWPVAGSYAIDDVTATVTDDAGLFRQTIDLDTGRAVEVNPRTPHDIHVGEGGEPSATGLGQYEVNRLGTGIEPAEVREYRPGDAVRQIDWKATARLDHPHVQEFEGGTDRETLLFLDRRAGMADGHAGARKLDYARQLALALVDRAHERGDELGYFAVGDGGLTSTITPTATLDTWATIRERLLDVSVTADQPTTADPARAAAVKLAGTRLEADESAFGRTLAPFFQVHRPYRRQVDSLPLYQAVTAAPYASRAQVRTVIITDDDNRGELREAVTYAHRMSDHVAVFLTPTPLFETGDLTDLARSYDSYVDFETFRRELASIGNVDAFEVGPADRLAAILAAGRDRRSRGNA